MPTRYSGVRRSEQPRCKPSRPASKSSKGLAHCKISRRQSLHNDEGFISCINSYLQQLDTTKPTDKHQYSKSNLQQQLQHQQKINQNLQKCLIQMHKVLWDRQQTIDTLHSKINHHYDNHHSSAKNSQESSLFYDQNCTDMYLRPRRKTEISTNIQKVLSKTIGIKPKNTKRIF